MSTTGAPTSRDLHTAVWTGNEMIIWGGLFNVYINTGGRYDPATDTWSPTSTLNAPSARGTHSAVWTGSVMVIFGGSGGGGSDLGGRYDPATDSWMPISSDGTNESGLHTAVWTGSSMLVWGGCCGGGTSSRYDPTTDSWTPISTTGAPLQRFQHTTVWTGSLMVVWGGGEDGCCWSTGGRYALGHSADDDGDGYSECDGDCSDSDPTVHPTAAELCDGRDNDCDGAIDEGCS
jgi:hypothetical protein